LGFTQAGLTGNKGLLPNGYVFRPEPLDRFRHYVGRAVRNETNANGTHDDAWDVEVRRCFSGRALLYWSTIGAQSFAKRHQAFDVIAAIGAVLH